MCVPQHLVATSATFQPRLFKKIGIFEINKALLTLGFGTWSALEPDGERDSEDYVKDKLNRTLFDKTQAIEARKLKEQEESKQSEKMTKAERKKWEFEQKMREKAAKRDDPDGTIAKAKAKRKALSYIAEERKLHEAYQILRSQHEIRRTERKKQKEHMAQNGQISLEKQISIDTSDEASFSPEFNSSAAFPVVDVDDII